MSTAGTMTPDEFDALVQFMRERKKHKLYQKSLDMMRAHFVDGFSVTEVRDAFETERDRVYRVRTRFLNAKRALAGDLREPVSVTVSVPKGTKLRVEKYARALWAEQPSA